MNVQLAALIVFRIADENGAGDIGAQRLRTQRQKRRIRMRAVLHTGCVASQGRGCYPARKNETPGLLAALQGAERDLRRLLPHHVARIRDHVLLDDVVRVGEFAVDKLGLASDLSNRRKLGRREKTLDLEEHHLSLMDWGQQINSRRFPDSSAALRALSHSGAPCPMIADRAVLSPARHWRF